jgi:hypothetical protein
MMMNGAPILLSLSDDKEFDEIMSRKLWQEVENFEDLLEFDY